MADQSGLGGSADVHDTGTSDVAYSEDGPRSPRGSLPTQLAIFCLVTIVFTAVFALGLKVMAIPAAYLGAVAAGTAVPCAGGLVTARHQSLDGLGQREALVVGVDCAFWSSFCASVILAIYGLAYGVLRLIDVFNVNVDAKSVATFIGGGAGFLLLLVVAAVTTDEVTTALTVTTAGVPSQLRDIAAKFHPNKGAWISNTAIIAAGWITMWLAPGDSAIVVGAVTLAWLFVLSAGTAPQFPSAPTPERPPRDTLDAFERSLQSLGYHVVRDPRTGDPSIDPFLFPIDLLAHKDETTLALDIRLSGSLSWTSALGVLTAARALNTAEAEVRLPRPVKPAVVMVDAASDESLAQFSQDEAVSVISIRLSDGLISAAGPDAGLVAVAQRFVAMAAVPPVADLPRDAAEP